MTRTAINCSLLALAALTTACSQETGSPESAPAVSQASAATESADAADLATAEAFIDAFYSFDREQLAPLLAAATDSAAGLLYYQGWAEGGNYRVLERAPCAREEAGSVACPVTVQDDPVVALGTGFNVTDTFHLTFENGVIIDVETSSDDQPIYFQARSWVEANMPEVMDGPCANHGTDAGTPADCARAMTAGYAAFAASEDFPGVALPPDAEAAEAMAKQVTDAVPKQPEG
ncbi:MAG: hypothetical protein V2J24_03195 [Pseudomonadales bacterium]|jgi:hypothetical protein|nr:hypothetical protein [Pseudomonadales bacterium]